MTTSKKISNKNNTEQANRKAAIKDLRLCNLSIRLMHKMNKKKIHPVMKRKISKQIAQLCAGHIQSSDLNYLRNLQKKHHERQESNSTQTISKQHNENTFDKSELLEEMGAGYEVNAASQQSDKPQKTKKD